ncbi:MAG: hypothetical protein R3E68_08895 [Burkholderiaceae bacterium]
MFFLSGRRQLFDVQVVGEQCLSQALAGGQGVLLVGAHLGSMESLRSIGHLATERRVSMAMFEQNAARIGRFLRAIDPALERDIVPLGQSGSMLVLHERLQEGGIVGLLADRSFGNDPGIVVPFLGHPASFPTGGFKMASILRCPVVTMAGLYVGGNRYRLHFVPLADFTGTGRGAARRQAIEQAVADYARQLEAFCHAAPYNWFNFYDFWAQPDAGADAVATGGGAEAR